MAPPPSSSSSSGMRQQQLVDSLNVSVATGILLHQLLTTAWQ
jgi:tRNA G18 (ribose-2'-O)-methylase SpoU